MQNLNCYWACYLVHILAALAPTPNDELHYKYHYIVVDPASPTIQTKYRNHLVRAIQIEREKNMNICFYAAQQSSAIHAHHYVTIYRTFKAYIKIVFVVSQ